MRVERRRRVALRMLSNLARSESERFERTIMPHQASAYNLARWLVRDADDAGDIVQEAFVRAFHHFGGFRGENPRAWLLTIVRNTTYTWLRQHRSAHRQPLDEIDPQQQVAVVESAEEVVLRMLDAQALRQAIDELPIEFREVILLREIEGFSYKEIASIADVPIGTVMSRLGRARERIMRQLSSAADAGRAAK